MFERFTERARQVVVLGQDEARGLGSRLHRHGVAARALADGGVDAASVKQ